MNLRVFTAQFAYKGEERLDTTVHTGASFIAPTSDMITRLVKNELTKEQFTQEYLEHLNTSMQSHPEAWIALLRRRKLVLVCHCGTGKCFCQRYVLALVLERLGARYMGEMNPRTNVMIPRDRYMPTVVEPSVEEVIANFEFSKREQTSVVSRPMVVDPLMINTMQSQTCRDCRDNREARAWAAGKTVSYQIVESSRVDDELGSKNFACCSHTMTQGEVKYTCPVFPKLIEGYNAGLTSQGTNLNPCKHCVEHMDNGGRCIGDRCPDGTFDIKEGAGIIRC